VKAKIKKIVLAYSGGLDTSVILKWLQDTYGCEVVTFTADIGQGEELEPARKKARKLGVKEIFVDDLREEFVRDFENWQVDADMMRAAKKDALFMHCLPAHRGEEVAGEVIDGPQSVVWEEAENRLHTQKALMEFLLLGKVKKGKDKKGKK
jgi:ornithine carbamoyltransferase